MKKHTILPLLLLFTLNACSAVVAVPSAADEDAPMSLSAGSAFTLQPGDKIKLNVYGEESLTDTFHIDADGMIALPLLGKVEASGLNKEALQLHIYNMLVNEGFLNSPHVTVDIDEMRPVYVMGEVRNPGGYEWKPLLTAFQAVASAGGYTPRAAQNMILIDRGVGEERKRLNATEHTPILPGDSITVRERIL